MIVTSESVCPRFLPRELGLDMEFTKAFVKAKLEEMGVQEGDTVSILDFEFEYVK